MSLHRGSIVASHLSIPRDLRKASVVEGVVDEEREGMAPMMSVIKEMVNYMLSDKAQAQADDLGFVPLSEGIQAKAQAAINKIKE